jgi:hypothetical protein
MTGRVEEENYNTLINSLNEKVFITRRTDIPLEVLQEVVQWFKADCVYYMTLRDSRDELIGRLAFDRELEELNFDPSPIKWNSNVPQPCEIQIKNFGPNEASTETGFYDNPIEYPFYNDVKSKIWIPILFQPLYRNTSEYKNIPKAFIGLESRKEGFFKNININELEKLRTYFSTLFKLDFRIRDEKRWLDAYQKLIKIQTQSFESVYEEIIRSLDDLRISFASYWTFTDFENHLYQTKESQPVLIKKYAYDFINHKAYKEIKHTEYKENVPVTHWLADDEFTVPAFAKNFLDEITKNPDDEFDYANFYFMDFSDGSVNDKPIKLLDENIFERFESKALFICPILDVPQNKQTFSEDKPHKQTVSKEKPLLNKDVKLRGTLIFMPKKNVENLVFYNKETLWKLSNNISKVVENAKQIAKINMVEKFRGASLDYLSDFQGFLNKVIIIIREEFPVQACSIFYYNETFEKLELVSSKPGIYDPRGGEIPESYYKKIVYDAKEPQRKTWQVFIEKEPSSSYFTFDRAKDQFKFADCWPEEGKSQTTSVLIVPIQSPDKKKPQGVIRFSNFKCPLNAEVVPFPTSYVDIFEHLTGTLGMYFLSYGQYSKFREIFNILPHEIGGAIRGINLRMQDFEEKYLRLQPTLEMFQHHFPGVKEDIKYLNLIWKDLAGEKELLNLLAYDNPALVVKGDIRVQSQRTLPYEDIVIKWVETFQPKAEHHDLLIHCERQKEVLKEFPPLMLDKSRVGQVLVNFLRNTLFYSYAQTRIDVNISYKEGFFKVSVTNLGVPILEEEKSKIFEFEYRGKKKKYTNEARGGLGIGLYISKKIVNACGGEIRVECNELSKYNFSYLHAIDRIGDPELSRRFHKDIEIMKQEPQFIKPGSGFNFPIIDQFIENFKADGYSQEDLDYYMKRETFKTTFWATFKAVPCK